MADTKVDKFKVNCKLFPFLVVIMKKDNMNIRQDK